MVIFPCALSYLLNPYVSCNMSRTVAITGSSGFIGQHLCKYFAECGWHVIALQRSKHRFSHPRITVVQYTIEDELPSAVNAANYIIHAAYIKAQDDRDAFKKNVSAAKRLLKWTEAEVSRKIIFLSSLSALEDANSVYGQQKFQIEQLFISTHVVIKPGLVIGNGGLFGEMKKYLMTKNTVPVFGNAMQPLQSIHVHDLCKFIELVINKNRPGVFVAAEEDPVPYITFYSEIGRLLNKKIRFVQVPFWFIKWVITVATLFRIKLPITLDSVKGLQQMRHIPTNNYASQNGLKLRAWKESLQDVTNSQ